MLVQTQYAKPKFATLSSTSHDVTNHFLTAGQANELLLGWSVSSKMQMLVRNAEKVLYLCCGYKMSELLYGWHRYCFTYSSTGYIKVCV